MDADILLANHIEKLRSFQRDQDIQPSSRNIDFAFLRKVVEEMHWIRDEIPRRFQALIELEGLGLEQFDNFVNSWNGEIDSVLVLAQRLHETYPEVKIFLQGVIRREIDGTSIAHRYDLSDPLTATQLSPLIRSLPEAECQRILRLYHEGVTMLHRQDETEKVIVPNSFFTAGEALMTRFEQNFAVHNHLEELFIAEALRKLPEALREQIHSFLIAAFTPKETWTIRTPGELKTLLANYPGTETYLSIFIRINQFLKDLVGGQRTAERLLQSLDSLLSAIPEELKALGVMQTDFNQFIRSELQVTVQPHGSDTSRHRFFVSHTTDHPKTLLEIGKYPQNTGSCQSYDYTNRNLVESLPGYVSDAHIQALAIRELECEEEPAEIISLDEVRGFAQIRTIGGQEVVVRMSKPISRSMVFLGSAQDGGVFTLQPTYTEPGTIQPEYARSLQEEALNSFIGKLQTVNPQLRGQLESETGIQIAGSHNPAGHYNDIQRGQQGKKGRKYVLGERDEWL